VHVSRQDREYQAAMLRKPAVKGSGLAPRDAARQAEDFLKRASASGEIAVGAEAPEHNP